MENKSKGNESNKRRRTETKVVYDGKEFEGNEKKNINLNPQWLEQ